MTVMITHNNNLLSINQVLLAVLVGGIPGILARGGLARVPLVEGLLGDTVEHLLREDTEELPCCVEGVEDGTLLVSTWRGCQWMLSMLTWRGSCHTLRNESPLKLVQELERELVLGTQSLLTNNGLHGCCITTNGVLGVKLVGDVGVIATSELLTNGRLHKTGERWQDVDGWVDTLVVELTVNEDLTLGNVTSKIGDRVSDVCEMRC